MSSESILESRKYYQRNKMLSIIRSQRDVSRFDIKKGTSYSMTTVLNTIEDMLNEGLIFEEQCEEIRIGRKPTWLRINPDGGYFIGVEFNSRAMHCVILDFTGEQIYSRESGISEKFSCAGEVIDMIKDNIRQAQNFLGKKRERIIGIGLGVPGYSDKKNGIAISYGHIKGWDKIPLRDIIKQEFGLPCYMENNVNSMIYAYKTLVYNGKCEDMLFVSVRTGARVIPVINNMPVSSGEGFPGELGHVKVSRGSRMCSCGGYGCLNTEVSDDAVVSKIRDGIRVRHFKNIAQMVQGNLDEITIETFVDSVLNGDEESIELMKQIGGFLGETISMLVNIFAPRKIVLYGELIRIGEPFLNVLRKCVKENSIFENNIKLQIEASEFGRDLGAIGAAAMVMQEEFNYVEETI